ncbi:MAG TPA: glycolate oxidase subunit GlcE [Bauldia sp.]|nr:glycolate oxidase subunit GlcE [Bauldia sp.]
MTLLSPSDERELAGAVAAAAAARTPLSVEGGGTRRGLGRPMQTAATLSTARMTGVTLYEPAELVVSARAGTPLQTVEALLGENRQRLAFEPIDHRPVLASSGTPTIGAVAAANLSGPRRIQAGAARDSLIGIRAVTGRGEAIKSGGRVMKNVTGYDLVKFLAGSYGTLGVFSEVTFKVLPVPETEATIVVGGLDDETAIRALSTTLASPWSVTGAAHLPPFEREMARTLVRIEGFAASVRERTEKLIKSLSSLGRAEVLPAEASAAVWQAVRDLTALGASPRAVVWRISVRPSDGPRVVAELRRTLPCRVLYDWGGGLVWIAATDTGDSAGAMVVREAVVGVGGHATLVRAPDHVRLMVDVFEPPPAPVMELTRKLKSSFDPVGILNPGRMYAGV